MAFHARIALCIALLPALASAQEAPLSPEAFDAATQGRTFAYATPGQAPYGAERHLSGRRVLWRWTDGDCTFGTWSPAPDGTICYAYEEVADIQCWSYRARPGGGFSATFEGGPGDLGQEGTGETYDMTEIDDPLECPGPLVGV
ncbi:MAG: hypothetical protein ACU0CO_06930 [Shimia sp.]